MSSRLRYSSSLRRRPTSIKRPRRLWWSCLCNLRCSVRSPIRLVRTAICTSAEPVSPVVRACSWMISVLASLVNVMVERQGYQRKRPSDLRRRSTQRRVGDQLTGARHIPRDRRRELVHGIVPDLVTQTRPELDRKALAGKLAVELQQERLDVQGLDAEGRVRPAVDRGSVPARSMFGNARVDPLARKEQPWPRAEVGRRVPETSTATVAGH